MSETTQPTTESPITRIQDGVVPTTARSPRVYRIAAGMGIAVGGVFITAVIFVFGFLIGSQQDTYVSDGEYDGGYEAGWDMDPGDLDDDGGWGVWTPPNEGGTVGGSVQPTTAPPAPHR
jgi:hypothetical protein